MNVHFVNINTKKIIKVKKKFSKKLKFGTNFGLEVVC